MQTKKKTLLGSSAAIVAAAALLAGGTFAAWSDFVTYDNSAGAEQLTLDVDSSGVIGFEQTAMAPGINREFDFVVASRAGQVVPAAALTLTLENLIGTEDGCTSTNSEEIDDLGACLVPGTGPGKGEFITDARIIVNASQPTTDLANACDSSIHPRGGRVSSTSLAALEGTVVDLLNGAVLAPGEGICVAMGLELPITANNASQGDSATWDFRYDLTQIVP